MQVENPHQNNNNNNNNSTSTSASDDIRMMSAQVVLGQQTSSRVFQSESLATMNMNTEEPLFEKLKGTGDTTSNNNNNESLYRRVRCPAHRYTPLRNDWESILTPLVQYLKLQVRFNTKTRSVELKTSAHTIAVDCPAASLQKGADFVAAYMLGFEVQDAVALLRLEDLFVESFQITDVKMLRGDHLGRAVGRIAGQDGKTRFAIENATRTRIIVADTRIHMLGSYANIRVARNAICSLILGAPPGKVYNNMRNVAKRMNERF